jgi:hypothetical protein
LGVLVGLIVDTLILAPLPSRHRAGWLGVASQVERGKQDANTRSGGDASTNVLAGLSSFLALRCVPRVASCVSWVRAIGKADESSTPTATRPAVRPASAAPTPPGTGIRPANALAPMFTTRSCRECDIDAAGVAHRSAFGRPAAPLMRRGHRPLGRGAGHSVLTRTRL